MSGSHASDRPTTVAKARRPLTGSEGLGVALTKNTREAFTSDDQ